MNVKRETVQRMFDMVVNSMDLGSGSLETEDVEALREVAVALGVDPALGTPSEFVGQYPHKYQPHHDYLADYGCVACFGPADAPLHGATA